jgi:hypothetical protein
MAELLLMVALVGAMGMGYRALQAFERVSSEKHALESRRLMLEERRSAASLEPEQLPADLQMRVERETEVWAREQLRALLVELYGRHQNWSAVRSELDRLDRQSNGDLSPGWSQTEVVR